MGRRRDKVWERVTVLKGGRGWKCNDCGDEFAGGASRIKVHLNITSDKFKDKGIRLCTGKANSNNDTEHNLLHPQDHRKSNEAGKIQGDAKYEEKIQVGSSSVSNGENEYLQVLQYVFQCLSHGEKVYESGRLNLNQKEFITFKPGTFLDSGVIDIFVEILTEIEKKKATPSNWYLPVMFSTAALVCDEHNFKDFVCRHKMRENYAFDQASPEKVFIPVHTGQATHGHVYLYIFHLNKYVIEIWDSLHNTFVAATKRDETTKKLLLAMEILFEKEKGAFSNYKLEIANDIFSQDKGCRFDCGVFVINYMQQSDNYVKRNPLLGFDSQKEREDLALKLLNNDLNQEKQNLYDKARRHYAQVEKQDGNKRLRVDTSKGCFEDVERERKEKYDDFGQRGDRHDDLEKGPPQSTSLKDQLIHFDRGQIQGDAKYQERIQVGSSSFVSNWENENLQMIQRVFECLSPEELVFRSPRLHLTKSQFITLQTETWLDSGFFAMEILFNLEKGAFSDYQKEMANDILSQDNGFDCGVFVINYMQQSDNYVKSNPFFQFDSQKEREDLALKLLTNDLNQEKQNLYDKARGRLYAQVEKQDGNERLRVDASKTFIEAKYDDRVNRHDGLQKGSSKAYLLPTTDLIGNEFQRYTEQIREWIMDDKVSAIGVWGIGGSGKTALATHIHNELILEEADSDNKVIWVTVSQNYSTSHLQKVIARSIELDISDEFEEKRIAGKLLQAFKEMKKCVVILDDVWDHFFLKEIGFPMSDNRIKFILTTRILEVCQGMGCEKNTIKVESLDEEDCWALFEEIMEFDGEQSLKVTEIARNIARECEGLPLAIVRIATSMKGKKHVREWSHMLECFKNLGKGLYEMDKWILPVLRSSYDFLNNKLQRFFLCFALSTDGYFDDGYSIARFVYESIDETKKLRVLDNEGYNMLDKLKNHGMLDRCYEEWRMNKFLRALAINIAEDTGKIMANACKNLIEIPSDDEWKEDLQKVFLMGNKIQTIPDGTCPRCSQLSTLLLNDNTNLNYISDDFFSNMPALKTLDLSWSRINRLPESVSSLKCLTLLLLSNCSKLSYIPSLSKLKRLISLDLSNTAIIEAPMGFESLVNLRCLNLLHTHMLMSSSLISKLINLEHLLGLEVREIDIQGLDNLEVIVAFFQDIEVFSTYVSLLDKNCKLSSFHLILEGANDTYNGALGTYWKDDSNSIKKINFHGMDLENKKVVLPGDVKKLVIQNCQLVGSCCLCGFVLSYGHNNNIPHQIELLDISGCEGVEYLCCFSGSCLFCSSSQLVGLLHLKNLQDLKDIVSPYALPSLHLPDLFSHLTDLSIEACNSMETLMTPKLLALLQNLRTIYVYNCLKMKEIVGEHHSQTAYGDLIAPVHNHLSNPTPITLPKLTSLKLYDMPQLNFVYRGIMLCPSLQTFYADECEKLIKSDVSSNGCELPMEKTFRGYRWPFKTDSSGHDSDVWYIDDDLASSISSLQNCASD